VIVIVDKDLIAWNLGILLQKDIELIHAANGYENRSIDITITTRFHFRLLEVFADLEFHPLVCIAPAVDSREVSQEYHNCGIVFGIANEVPEFYGVPIGIG